MFPAKLTFHTKVTKKLARRRRLQRRIETVQMISLVAAVAVDQRNLIITFADAARFTKLTVRAPPGR